MLVIRFFVLAGALALMGVASPAAAQKGGKQALDSAALVNRFPEALVYEGVARFWEKDYTGAIEMWTQYLAKAGNDADTSTINQVIHEAHVLAYPEALLYEGVALVKAGDTLGATRAWERLQELAPEGTDTAVVRELIEGVFFRAYPLARLYQGFAYYLSSDFDRAIGSWEKYLTVCSKEGERRQVRQLILTAKERLNAQTIALKGKVR